MGLQGRESRRGKESIRVHSKNRVTEIGEGGWKQEKDGVTGEIHFVEMREISHNLKLEE